MISTLKIGPGSPVARRSEHDIPWLSELPNFGAVPGHVHSWYAQNLTLSRARTQPKDNVPIRQPQAKGPVRECQRRTHPLLPHLQFLQ